MTPEQFGSHLDLFKKLGLHAIRLDKLHRIITGIEELSEPSIVITFDDCTADNWIYAVPELLKRRMQGAFFAITDFVRPGQVRLRSDQTNAPDSVPAFPEIMRSAINGHCDDFMNQMEILALVHDIGMEVYSHSAAHQACFTSSKKTGFLSDKKHWSHPALCGKDGRADTPVYPVGSAYAHGGFGLDWHGRPLELQPEHERLSFCLDDFSNSKSRLESILNRPCPFLCLPWGQYDDVTLDAARQAGYAGVLNLGRGAVHRGTDSLRIGRLAVKDGKSRAWLFSRTLLRTNSKLSALLGVSNRRQA